MGRRLSTAGMGRRSQSIHPARTARLRLAETLSISRRRRRGAYIEVIGLAHLQPPVPPRAGASVTIADDVFKRVAAAPLATVSADVALHAVGLGEVVPRSDQMNDLDRRVGLPKTLVSRSVGALIYSGQSTESARKRLDNTAADVSSHSASICFPRHQLMNEHRPIRTRIF